jgi:hypothetical protein
MMVALTAAFTAGTFFPEPAMYIGASILLVVSLLAAVVVTQTLPSK